MAKLPTVVSNLTPDLRAFINRVREAIDGKGNDKLVTVDDLIRGGIAVPGPGGTIIPPAGGVTIATPPAPTSLSATGAIQNIIVEWDDPRYFGHAYAEVWGASTDSLGDAVLLGMTPGSIYVDALGPGSVRYYWVRFVNTLDTAGPYNAVDGTRGETGPDVEYLLETLTGAITETQLFDELGSRIDLVDQTNGGLVSKYTVKIDTNGYVSGFGLASTTNTATPLSDFIIRADRFSIASPTGPGITPVIPFVVTTTPQTINGVTVPVGVYINGAFIQNGTITNAKIGNAAIDDAKIANLSAGKITAGSISVGSYIQSSNYLIGSQGWKIHGDGTAEFAAASIRGQLTAAQINSNGLSIRNTAGTIILNAGTGDFTGSVAGTAASTVVSNASTALSTANTAESTANSAASAASTAQSTANTANSTANTAITELTTKLDNDARNVLSGSGGIAMGTLNWDTSGNRTSGYGVGITRAGLVAYNSSGVATFTLNGTTGTANLSGSVNVGSFTGYAWPPAGQGGAHLSANGFLIGNVNGGGKYFQIDSGLSTGNAAIYTNIPANLEDAQVTTLKIAGNAVSTITSVRGAVGFTFTTSTAASLKTSTATYPAGTILNIFFTTVKTISGRGDINVVLNLLNSSNGLVAEIAGGASSPLVQTMGPLGDKVTAIFTATYTIPTTGSYKVEAYVSNNFGDSWTANYADLIVFGSKR